MTDQPQTKSSGWAKTKHGSKAAFDKGWALFEKLGAPVNKLTNKIGSEAFWPTELGPECDKSARILKSFCKDGFYKDQPKSASSSPGPKNKAKVLVKIPQKVIQNCVGIAIFSVMRTGLWISGAGGSGVLLAKDERGNWSPPSGILIHTLGVGFMAGIDIYDCVLVINNREALAAFSKVRVSLGSEVSIVAGPLGIGGVVESELTKDRRPVFSYMKSRGLYGGIQLDGTIIIERNDENARFYGQRLPIKDILDGHVKQLPPQTHMLLEVVKAAEGRSDVDQSVMQSVYDQPPPGDMEVEAMSHPTAQQAAAYAPPPDYYAPNEDQKYLHSQYPGSPSYDGSHPSHPGPPDGSYSYPNEKAGGGGSGSAAQGQIESDAALAARLQAEEDNNAAAPPQPPRPLQSQAHYPQDQYPQQDYQPPTGPPTGYGQSVYQTDQPGGHLPAVHGPAQSNYQPPATAHGAVQQSQDGPYLQGQMPQMQMQTEQHPASYPGSQQTQHSQPGAPYYYPPPPTEPSR